MPIFAPQPGDTTADRGRLAALDYRRVLEGIPPILQAVVDSATRKVRNPRRRKRTRKSAQSGMHLLMLISVGIFGHLTSYDKVLRPPFVPSGPRVAQPWVTETEATFKLNTRFGRQDFIGVVQELSEVPQMLLTRPGTRGYKFPKALGIYVVMRRLSTGGRWENVEREMNVPRSTLCEIHTATVAALYLAYRLLTSTIDFRRVKPMFRDWIASMAQDGISGTPDVCFIMDGKAWQWSKPGSGMAAEELAAKVAAHAGQGYNVNLVQRAYYNGNYRLHGAKVQHLLEVDGVIICYVSSVRVHDARMYRESTVEAQLSTLYVVEADGTENPFRPIKALSDLAYPDTEHCVRQRSQAALAAIPNAANRQAAEDAQKKDQRVRGQVECSFQKVMSLNALNRDKSKFCLLNSAGVAWEYTQSIWHVEVLFANLHTCLYGSQVTGFLGVEPPTVYEYLYSANNGFMVEV